MKIFHLFSEIHKESDHKCIIYAFSKFRNSDKYRGVVVERNTPFSGDYTDR